MKFRKLVPTLCAASLVLSACVSPDVVQTTTISDDALTCDQIKTQLGQLDEIRGEAKKGKTASGKNIAAAILFWPAVIGNYSNAQEALEAANKRQTVLVELYKRKKCS